ncbi:MAG: hypothetical protein LBR21_09335 [Propionibacteriaceae bacterium]|jgi:hypothetical protein|nr:hypothetical protein [Propionibacteriaceae bacterium]
MDTYRPRRIADDALDAPFDAPDEEIEDKPHWRGRVAKGVLAATCLIAGFSVVTASTLTSASQPAQAVDEVTMLAKSVDVPEPTPEKLLVGGVLDSSQLDSSSLLSLTRAYVKAEAKVYKSAKESGEPLATLAIGKKVTLTGETKGSFSYVIAEDAEGWVSTKALTTETADLAKGIIETPCERNTGNLEAGLTAKSIRVFRSVCTLFPDVLNYGGRRADSLPYHPSGRALDVMLASNGSHVNASEEELGWRIADYVTQNWQKFDIDHIIFMQKIWTPSNPNWRLMSDRGSDNANHKNHVHIAVKS